MKTLVKVSMAFMQLLILLRIAFYRNVATMMTGNTKFANPTVPLAEFTTQLDLVEAKNTAAIAARTAAAVADAALQEALLKADTMGQSLARYVEGASMGSAMTLETSGFELAPQPKPVGVLPAPTGLRGETAQEGQARLRWNRKRGVSSWTVQCGQSATGPWTEIYSGTRATCLAIDLVSGTQYWFRVQAIGAAGPSDWSVPTSKRAA